ncbi:MAG: bifunctional NADP-dependent methylenetetrahydromethanopterin dehydrogenase/methylenetetrahydrofolate dehydrogenase [Planctomycetes bacterium]|nr:bifunctional NADP-dependent methylenetetrahydromethanopterin dehydrogenase/methylenetetrahydrofolate dehydrogenase [Planctomycetota bacterium]
MDKRKILIQLDSDPHASVFDRVVAVDAGADEIFSYASVKPEQVQGLVHGAIFTRGPKSLKSTAIFVGGSDVLAGEKLMAEALKAMIPKFGLRVSIMLDANGANTTAAAAVWSAGRHLNLKDAKALVLGGTGPVGQRVVRLLAREGAGIRVGSRQQARAAAVCQEIASRVPNGRLQPLGIANESDLTAALEGRTLVFAAGAAGVVLLPKAARESCPTLQVAIDLNAVPPLGIEEVSVTDAGVDHDGVICYGAIGVGDTKMKIHRAAVASLFETNDKVLDAEEIYQLAQTF